MRLAALDLLHARMPAMCHSGQNLCERHEWREGTSSRYVRYILDPYFGSINPPFPGCWHLVKAVNSSNGSSKTFNSWINHGSLNSC